MFYFIDFHILLKIMTASLGLTALYTLVRLREPTAPSELGDLPVLDDEHPADFHMLEQPTVVTNQK